MRFTVEGEPVAKERPRFNRKTGTVYTPRTTKAYEDTIAYTVMAMGSKLSGPVSLTATIYTGNKKLDVDNVLKTIADGCNGHAYNDDQQICEVHLYRVWSTNPRVEVEIEETEERTEDR